MVAEDAFVILSSAEDNMDRINASMARLAAWCETVTYSRETVKAGENNTNITSTTTGGAVVHLGLDALADYSWRPNERF